MSIFACGTAITWLQSGRRQDPVVKNDVTHSAFLSSVIVPMTRCGQKSSVFGEDVEDGVVRRRTGGSPGHGYRAFGATRSSVTTVAFDGAPPRVRDGSL